MIRLSSPEVARACPAPYASMSVVLMPARRAASAVHAPIVPAPTTAVRGGHGASGVRVSVVAAAAATAAGVNGIGTVPPVRQASIMSP